MKRKFMSALGLILVSLTCLTGCRVGPRHTVPSVPVEEEWHADRPHSDDLDMSECSELLEMWQLFEDPLLNGYLESLIYTNLDIKAAYAKVCQAYATRRMAVAGLFPYFDSRIDYHSSKPAGGILTGGPDAQTGTTNQPLGGIPLNLKEQTFLANFDAAWEIDFFGKKRNEVAASTAFLEMQIENKNAVYVSLLAEFGRTYLELRTSQNSKRAIEREIAFLSERVETEKDRFNQGLDSELSLLTFESSLRTLKAELCSLESAIQTSIYHLSRLLGKTPGCLFEELSVPSPLPKMADQIPVGVPSDLLRRRPDVRYAERQLAEATAEVGVAVADLYPRLVIDGSYGYQDLHLGAMKGQGESWSYGGNILTPIFHWGKLRSQVLQNQWIRKEAIFEYENTVLKALEEAEGAMFRLLKSKESLHEKALAYTKQRELLGHTQDLFTNGLANQIDLQEAEINTSIMERDLLSQQGDAAIQLIALYKALGGGWR